MAHIAPAPGTHGLPPAPVAAPFMRGADGVPRITGRPPFKAKGPKDGKPGLDRAEFARQLTGQQDGLNRLTVAEFLANRDRYEAQRQLTGDGRAPEGDAAQRVAREEALRDKQLELRRQDPTLTRKQGNKPSNGWRPKRRYTTPTK